MQEYKELVYKILTTADIKHGRNGNTLMLPGTTIKFNADNIPLLNNRKMFIKGVVGEFAAFMSNSKTVEDFKHFGCNYWDSWADTNGNLVLDYVNQLHAVLPNGNTVLEDLKVNLRNDPFSRRHIINLWRPENLDMLSLPCCHFAYQFIVDNDKRLHMIWTQRSADVMVGIPSDMILAYLWVQCLAKELGFEPGIVTMNFGDTHIYEEHVSKAYEYIEILEPKLEPIAYLDDTFTSIENFEPEQLIVAQYDPHPAIKFELKV